MERVLALCAKVVSKCNWIAQHSQLRGQLTRVVIRDVEAAISPTASAPIASATNRAWTLSHL